MDLSIEIRRMAPDALDSIGQVDRTESVKALYLPRLSPDGMGLMLERVAQEPPLRIPPWGDEGSQRRAGQWRAQIEDGGVLLGAFREGKLIGFTIMGPELGDGSAELCALFVDASHRRSGVGSMLMDEIEREAGRRGIRSLFLYSNETESSVRFYRKHGCRIVGLMDKVLVKHLHGDVIFAKRVRSRGETPG